jgi:hypothetical protein
MKRDLKKWLRSDKVAETYNIVSGNMCDEEICSRIIPQNEGALIGVTWRDSADFVESLWMEAQKAFLKEMLDDIDNNIDKLFKGKSQVTGSDAKNVAYEEDLKKYIYNKYLYLKSKNGE